MGTDTAMPSLLYLCDFPPAPAGGGASLIDRLLRDYPPDRQLRIVGSCYWHQFRSTRGATGGYRTRVFPTSSKTGRWGMGRLKELGDWMLIPLSTVLGIVTARRAHCRAVLTVAHGHLFVAAALVAKLSHLPLILIVHDEWVGGTVRGKLLPRFLASRIFEFIVRSAAHIYAVSPEMSSALNTAFGVSAEVQLPGTDRTIGGSEGREPDTGPFKIVFSGTLSGGVVEGLQTLAALVGGIEVSNRLCELHILAPISRDDARRLALDRPGVVLGDWVPQQLLQPTLETAHLLFLPYTFDARQANFTGHSFPSKLADYLAAARPVIIFGPADSTAVRYARQHGFAEVVDVCDRHALRSAIARLLADRCRRETMAARALATFYSNHDAAQQRAAFHGVVQRLSDGGPPRQSRPIC